MIDSARLAVLEREVARLSRQLQLVIAHLQIELPADPAPGSEAVMAMLGKGDLLGAIKAYREETGASLAEAKSAVEAIASELSRG